MRNILVASVMTLGLATSGAALAAAGPVKIAFTIHSSPSNTFWQAVKKGFDDACGKVQAQCQMKTIRKLAPTVFWPQPGVDSAIVRIDPNPGAMAHIKNRGAFQVFLRDVFSQRRKRLRGVVANLCKNAYPAANRIAAPRRWRVQYKRSGARRCAVGSP